MAIWSYLLSAILGGAMVPTQFGINAQLAGWLGGSVRAAFGHLIGAKRLFTEPGSVKKRAWNARSSAPWTREALRSALNGTRSR